MLNIRNDWLNACACRVIPAILVAISLGFSPALAQAPPQVPALPADGQASPQPQQQPGTTPAPGGAAAEPAPEPPTEAERQIDAAITAIGNLKSVAADLVQSVEMLNLKFTIKGRFMRAPNTHIYLRLTLSGLTDSTGTTLQVCDGDILWDYQQVLEKHMYRKLSIKPILERLNSPDLDARIKNQFSTQMGITGPEVLLVNLRKVLKFDQKPEPGVLDGKNVLIFHGTWRTRQALVGPDTRPVNPIGALPPYIPMDATLYLGKDDQWPYKVVLAGRVPSTLMDLRRVGPDGKLIGAKSTMEKIVPSRIELVYSNVKLNPTIRLDEFAFQAPPSEPVDDSTELLVKALDNAIQMEVQRKKNEAAKKDGPVIDTPIEVPAPPGSIKPPE
jgi:outer membrane lipoprotein-sorting protein